MRSAWARLGLRGRLAISIGTIVVLAFAAIFVAVRIQMSRESAVIQQEEGREVAAPGGAGERHEGAAASPIADAHSDVEKTIFLVGGLTLAAALLAGYLLAARTAAPLRRFAATATAVDAGDLTPRLHADPASAAELRALAEAFNHMLDRLDAAFSQQRRFVSDASHELRSPLTAVRGQLEVLARSESPDAGEVRRVERVAMAELARVERLVEEMLALARLDEGEGPRPRPLDAASFLRGIAADAPGRAEVGELAAGTLEADPELLARVVRNLLENGRRHAGGRVAVSSRAVGGRLLIAVDDDGPGIAAEERERVFDRFHRSDAARDRASGGSGLGLAISREIVEAHGGRIWAEPSSLGGARLCLELPGFTGRP
ncbi:MAG: HAMP domain-containing protein [Actinobacteria bacterium]|nr:HAMP domain-containing protein [Actinomycetota bacterium]